MWLILYCFSCIVDAERDNRWSAESALAARWDADFVHEEVAALGQRRFETQEACLRELRAALPEHERDHTDPQMGFSIRTNVTHHADYVEEYNFTNFAQIFYFACFREEPRIW